MPLVILAAFAAACSPVSTAPKDAVVQQSVGGGSASFTPAVDATGATDVSGPMAAFLASVPDGSTIALEAGGVYRLEETFLIADRRDLTIAGNGATFIVTRDNPENPVSPVDRRSVEIVRSTGITIRDLNVVGANPVAGKRAPYTPEREGQHGFQIASSTNVSLIRVSVTDTWGDFVYIGRKKGTGPSVGVLIQDSTFTRSGRQGITLTAARNVTIESSTITEAKRASFDLEPGYMTGDSIYNVTIRNNQVSGGRLLFVAAAGHQPINDVTIQGNTLSGMAMGIYVNDAAGGRRSNWKVLDNTSDTGAGGKALMNFIRVDGVTVTGNTQPMKFYSNKWYEQNPDRMVGVGVLADSSCQVSVWGNDFPNASMESLSIGVC